MLLDPVLIILLIAIAVIVAVGEIVRVVLTRAPLGTLVIQKDNENRISDTWMEFTQSPADLKHGQYYTIRIDVKK